MKDAVPSSLAIVCTLCGEEYPLDTFEWRCIRCGGLFEIEGQGRFDPGLIDRSLCSLWRYAALLSLPNKASPVSMGEGWTPLVPIHFAGARVLGKMDFLMPTGSFKDRGSAVLATALEALNISCVAEDSSGNAAASLAAYCARAGIQARIFVPSHASPAKLAQIRVYGARVTPIDGPRENSAVAATDAVVQEGAYYASHYYNPFAMQGMKTTAWELWEQLGGRAPDNLVVPVGHGTNFIGMYRGFVDLRAAGLISGLPRFFAAQAENVAPLVTAFKQKSYEPATVEPLRTIAEGIAITHPVRGADILRAVNETGGAVVATGEAEIQDAREHLAHQGIFVEPTSAAAFAGLLKLQEQMSGEQLTVISLTGSGLKSP